MKTDLLKAALLKKKQNQKQSNDKNATDANHGIHGSQVNVNKRPCDEAPASSRTVLQAPPAHVEAEPQKHCVPRRNLGTSLGVG